MASVTLSMSNSANGFVASSNAAQSAWSCFAFPIFVCKSSAAAVFSTACNAVSTSLVLQLNRIGITTYRKGPLIFNTPGLSSSINSRKTSSCGSAFRGSIMYLGLKAMDISFPL